MLLARSNAHLTYCTNIHPGETWEEVRANLDDYVVNVKARVSPDRPFGVGLRLSAAAARTLARPERLSELLDFLRTNDLYVFTINGFPYGTFHGTHVKEAVYEPDWRDDLRVEYSNLLAELLARMLPDSSLHGTVSTVPGAFRSEVRSATDVRKIADQMIRHAATLHGIRARTGRTISLAIEPEPCCFLETIVETVAFFENYLFSKQARDQLSRLTDLSASACEGVLRRHLGVCLDTCHAAVEYEDPVAAVRQLRDAGIDIKKVQLSTGLRVHPVSPEAVEALTPYLDEVYLHQVVERRRSILTRYIDLPDAIKALGIPGAGDEREWRVHFHVPIFLQHLGAFENTQPFLRDVLAGHASESLSPHLEVETYTWEVLPESLRGEDVISAISRELHWVMEQLSESPGDTHSYQRRRKSSTSG